MDISDLADGEAPESFRCPISRELMRDPVVCADGHSYERDAIVRWLRAHDTSPKTGAALAHRHVLPNHALRNSIEEHLERTFKITQRSQITIGREIGVGSFKTAHAGELRGQRVAVLKMRPGAQCEAEVKAFIHLGRHPNLVRFLGLCAEGEPQLIVTEYAPLGSLDAFLEEREGQLTLPHKLTAAQQVCSGMAALAAQGLVHRDLAARNVLVFAFDAASPNATRVKVSDFGLSMSVYGATHGYGAAHEAAPFRWMPPEALRRRKFSEKSDVWACASRGAPGGVDHTPARWPSAHPSRSLSHMLSYGTRERALTHSASRAHGMPVITSTNLRSMPPLPLCVADGVTLWEMLTDAQTPYAFISSDQEVAQRVCAGERPEEPPDCPAALWALMQRCWAASAEARPTFEHLLLELRTMADADAAPVMGLPVPADGAVPMGQPAEDAMAGLAIGTTPAQTAPPTVQELISGAERPGGGLELGTLMELVRSGSAEGKAVAAGALAHLAANADNLVAMRALGHHV